MLRACWAASAAGGILRRTPARRSRPASRATGGQSSTHFGDSCTRGSWSLPALILGRACLPPPSGSNDHHRRHHHRRSPPHALAVPRIARTQLRALAAPAAHPDRRRFAARGHRAANRGAASAIGRATAHVVEYAGPEEAAALRARLSAADVPDATLRFALKPGTTGANRNLAVLLSRGEHILLLDDDILCTPWTLHDAAPGVAVGGDEDLRTFDFFESRHDAVAAGRPSAVGLLDGHAELLGARLSNLAAGAEPIDLTTASADLLAGIDTGRGDRVRATFPGLAGDSGTSCPHLLLFASGALKSRLHDPAAFAIALGSREVTRIAGRHVVTRLPNCMAGCMGLANDGVIPPFLSEGRNSDGLFGVMFHFADPTALFGHLRYGVVHDSARPSPTAHGNPLGDRVRAGRPADLVDAASRLHVVHHLAGGAALPPRRRAVGARRASGPRPDRTCDEGHARGSQPQARRARGQDVAGQDVSGTLATRRTALRGRVPRERGATEHLGCRSSSRAAARAGTRSSGCGGSSPGSRSSCAGGPGCWASASWSPHRPSRAAASVLPCQRPWSARSRRRTPAQYTR